MFIGMKYGFVSLVTLARCFLAAQVKGEYGLRYKVCKGRVLIRCGIPTRIKAKFVTQIRDKKIPSVDGAAFVKKPRWDQRSLKCPWL